MSTYKPKKPIDNFCFYYDPILSTQYEKKKDVPPANLHRCEYWDSLLEFKLYEELLKRYAPEQIKRQYIIRLMPKHEPFKEWTWSVDFKLDLPVPIYIEAKGKWLIESLKAEGFWKTLRVLQNTQLEVWDRLVFVGSDKDGTWHIPQSTIQVRPMRELDTLLNW
jgi:hypothetical protein